jgi:hypothetical protein
VPKNALPQFVAPMMASSAKEPFNDPDWIFETKLDGYRAIAVIDATGKARIWSHNHLPLDGRSSQTPESITSQRRRIEHLKPFGPFPRSAFSAAVFLRIPTRKERKRPSFRALLYRRGRACGATCTLRRPIHVCCTATNAQQTQERGSRSSEAERSSGASWTIKHQ